MSVVSCLRKSERELHAPLPDIQALRCARIVREEGSPLIVNHSESNTIHDVHSHYCVIGSYTQVASWDLHTGKNTWVYFPLPENVPSITDALPPLLKIVGKHVFYARSQSDKPYTPVPATILDLKTGQETAVSVAACWDLHFVRGNTLYGFQKTTSVDHKSSAYHLQEFNLAGQPAHIFESLVPLQTPHLRFTQDSHYLVHTNPKTDWSSANVTVYNLAAREEHTFSLDRSFCSCRGLALFRERILWGTDKGTYSVFDLKGIPIIKLTPLPAPEHPPEGWSSMVTSVLQHRSTFYFGTASGHILVMPQGKKPVVLIHANDHSSVTMLRMFGNILVSGGLDIWKKRIDWSVLKFWDSTTLTCIRSIEGVIPLSSLLFDEATLVYTKRTTRQENTDFNEPLNGSIVHHDFF